MIATLWLLTHLRFANMAHEVIIFLLTKELSSLSDHSHFDFILGNSVMSACLEIVSSLLMHNNLKQVLGQLNVKKCRNFNVLHTFKGAYWVIPCSHCLDVSYQRGVARSTTRSYKKKKRIKKGRKRTWRYDHFQVSTTGQYRSLRPAVLRAFCMRARSWNCFLDRRRTCCNKRDRESVRQRTHRTSVCMFSHNRISMKCYLVIIFKNLRHSGSKFQKSVWNHG